MVGHILNYHPSFTRLHTIVRSGELGDVLYIYSNRLNLGQVRREENILWSFAWPTRCFIPVRMRVYITADGTDLDADGGGIARR